jgi:hypothetical protein
MGLKLSREELADVFEENRDVFVAELSRRSEETDLSFRFSTGDAVWRDGELYIEKGSVAGEAFADVMYKHGMNMLLAFVDAITDSDGATPYHSDVASERQMLVKIDNRVKRLTDFFLDNKRPSGTPPDSDEPEG